MHNDLLHIVTMEGDPDWDSVLGPKPYTFLVPINSPWNNNGKNMIGVHNHTGAAIPPTLFSPKRYQWLYDTHSRLQNHKNFTQDLFRAYVPIPFEK